MLKIRMQRVGRINQPAYRIVVIEHTASPKAGKFVEKVGTYNPTTKARTIDEVRVKYWMSVGAKPSPTMHNMLVSAGIISGKKINVLPTFKEPAKEEVATEAPAKEEVPEPETHAEAPVFEGAAEETPASEEIVATE